MTDLRMLCAELVEKLDELNCNFNVPNQSSLIERALDALAQPESQGSGPTDEELINLFNENNWNYISPETFLDIARSVLELR